MAARDDEQPVETLLPDRPDPSLRHGVGLGRSVGRADYLDTLRRKDVVECGRELAISVVYEKAHLRQTVVRVDAEVACLLDHPWTVGVGAAPGDGHALGGELNEEQYVDSGQKHRLDREEVAADDTCRLLGKKLPPGRLASPWGGAEAVPTEDPRDRRGGDLCSELLELALNALVAPARVLTGEAHNQVFDVTLDRRAAV